VADAFCAQQVSEATNGHFLMDGIPPYARTSFAGVFGSQSENSVSWVTTGQSFSDPIAQLALLGHEDMMAEKPPGDGHRRTILDPEATHVGVGYAVLRGRFQMAQEFLTRGLERLSITGHESSRPVLRFDGKALPNWQLQFVTIARESSPAPLTREEASGRTSYSYPRAGLAYTSEGAEPASLAPRLRTRSDSGPREISRSLSRRPARPARSFLHGRPKLGARAAGSFGDDLVE
jgi:hypothetical protein